MHNPVRVTRVLRPLVFAIGITCALSACGGTSSTTGAPTSTTRSAAPAAVTTVIATTPVAPQPTTAPPTTVPPTTTVALAAPTTPAPAAQAIMPAVVCMNLQAAQNTIQAAGVFFSRSKDATGAGRKQIVDSNWVVVSQSPAPGTPFGEGEAVLSVVKYGERGAC